MLLLSLYRSLEKEKYMFKWFKGERARRFLGDINHRLVRHNARATDVTPHSVNVEGDSKHYGPAIIVQFSNGTTTTEAGEAATELINNSLKHARPTRILMEIPTDKS